MLITLLCCYSPLTPTPAAGTTSKFKSPPNGTLEIRRLKEEGGLQVGKWGWACHLRQFDFEGATGRYVQAEMA